MSGQHSGAGGSGRAGVLHPTIKGAPSETRTPEACLAEARGLAEAIDLQIVHAVDQEYRYRDFVLTNVI